MRKLSAISRRTGRRGQSAIEFTLMVPWILLLFIAVFDLGFYAYTLVSVENAARVAALYTSNDTATADDSYFACVYALQDLRMMLNVGFTTSCTAGCAPGSACSAGSNITVQARRLNGQNGVPWGVDGRLASEVTVTYRGIQLFPLPWLMGKLDVTRIVQMRVV